MNDDTAEEVNRLQRAAITDGEASLDEPNGSASEVKAALERIRADKKPTRRGVIICGQVMGQMLQIGWHPDQLDALEILFWRCRDANGDVIRK